VLPVQNALAMGMSPPSIPVNLLRNTSQEKHVTLYRAPKDVGDMFIEVDISQSAGKFIQLTDKTFTIPAGQEKYQYNFTVNGGDAPNGEHLAQITFLKIPDPIAFKEGASSVVKTGSTLKVPITIDGKELIDFELLSIRGLDTEIGKDLEIYYVLTNKGNVDWRPDKITLSFIDADDETVIEKIDVLKETLPFAKAGTEYVESYFQTKHTLPEGAYNIQAEFFHQEKSVGVLDSKEVFDVLPEGTLKQSAEIKTVKTNKSTYVLGEKIKMDLEVENTGSIPVNAILYASVSKDGEFLDLVRGSEYEIPTGQKIEMTQILDYAKTGNYSVDTYVEYGKKKTDIKKITFKIQSGGSFSGVLIAGISLLVVGFIGFLLYKKKKEKGTKTQSKNTVIENKPTETHEVISGTPENNPAEIRVAENDVVKNNIVEKNTSENNIVENNSAEKNSVEKK
jgi:hypothetical protein